VTSKVALVVPTIRENSMKEFVERWNKISLFDRVELIVIEDNPKKTFEIPVDSYHYSWEDIDNELGDKSWIIPRRSDTVRSFGYLKAYQKSYDYILTLDDDCYPPTEEDGIVYLAGEDFVDEHVKYLETRSRWYNTLDMVKPRGIPYLNKGTWKRNIINHGLWTNILDYDAPTQLVNPEKEVFSFDNRIVPYGLFFPMCGMNVAWKREATVLMYHLLMGNRVFHFNGKVDASSVGKLPFDRFGDIWCGLFAKKICDKLGYTISTGMPYIRHERASNPLTNLKKEAPGLEVNEKFWEYVDFADLGQGDLTHAYHKMGEHIANFDDFPDYKGYFAELGKAMKIWSELIQKSDER
jgi:hypothetical protein